MELETEDVKIEDMVVDLEGKYVKIIMVTE